MDWTLLSLISFGSICVGIFLGAISNPIMYQEAAWFGAVGQWFAGFTTLTAVVLSLYFSQKSSKPIADIYITTLGDIHNPSKSFFLSFTIRNVGGRPFHLKNCKVELKNHVEYTRLLTPYIVDSMIVPGNNSECLMDIGDLLIEHEEIFKNNKLRLTIFDFSGNKFISEWFNLEKAIEHFNDMCQAEEEKNGKKQS